jgi:hypothetical protein
MAEVRVSRFVSATPSELRRVLTPAAIIEHEGSFTVREVRETAEGWTVLAKGGGMTVEIAFESRTNGFRYEQRRGPLAQLETTLTHDAENEGSRVTMVSVVQTGTPPRVITDRVAAWKRRGELQRALSGIAADVE